MDELNVNNIDFVEFIDLSELDENERNEVKSCLHCTDSCVQLPWVIPIKPKSLYTDTVHSNKRITEGVHPNVPPQQHFEASYSNITICNDQHEYQSSDTSSNMYFISSQPPNIPSNSVAKLAVDVALNHKVDHSGAPPSINNRNTNISLYPESSPTSNNHVQNDPTQETQNIQQNGINDQNGTQNSANTATASAPAKSWANLFSPNTASSSLNAENGLSKPAFNSTSLTDGNSKQLCPIKYPKKTQIIIDPALYRMGEYLAEHVVDNRTISLQPRGLINRSNYCYINSILQALIACPPVYNLISGLNKVFNQNDKKKPSPVIDGICTFVREFSPMPDNMRTKRADKTQKKDQNNILINYDAPFEPTWIYKMLSGKSSDSFLIEGRQEDAEEFLGCILNGLNDEMLELIKLVKTEPAMEDSDADKDWLVIGRKNKGSITRRTDFGKTPISGIFGGLLKSRIQRIDDNPTDNIQPFFTLQLNIEKVSTVREALDSIATKNLIEGVTSSKTNKEIEAWQLVTIEQLPTVLILHLKCFDYKVDGCTKIIKALEFPIDLKLDSKLLSAKINTPKEKQYKLFAVVYHDGKEASKGHYVTDAYHVGYGTWLRYDDASVKPVQEENVLNPQGTRVPYLLFYRRSERTK